MLLNTVNDRLLKISNDLIDQLPQSLKFHFTINTFVAGGAILSLLRGEEPNDIDIYFRNPETALLAAKHFKFYPIVREFYDILGTKEDRIYLTETNYSIPKEEGLCPVFVSPNAITLNNGFQLIMRYTGDPESIISKFDFAHTQMYWSRETGVKISDKAKNSLILNELLYLPGAYPLSSLFRLRKFLLRGWNISIGQLTKLSMQLSKMDYTDLRQLKDQLNGVDVQYIDRLIYLLENEKDITEDRIINLIDELFQ